MPIYRGSGGSGNSNTSANANQVAIDAAAAAQSAIDAAASAAAALVSENEAESAETNAETSETNAATSATNAGTSETNAATSATNAGTSETNAATSATNAGTSETNAATSASNASTSETNAASSASTATTKAAEASTSATNASNSATASASSATASANSATASAASATASAASAAAAQAAQEAIDGLYLGAQASDPTVDLNGDPVTVGDWYFNTTINKSKIYNGSGWDVLTADGSVTSVTGTGTVSGLTLTGTVTAAGNLTLGGALSGITASQLSSQNISQWTNDSGYTTNTGTVTPSSTDTFTNKSGNISQWTNDSGYITGYTETDTLDSVTGRGATTTNAVTVGSLTSTGIDDNATSTAITIDSSERVGINIIPTTRALEVKSIANAQIITSFKTGSGITGRISIMDANTTADSTVGIGCTGNNLDFYAGAAAKATLSDTGNLSVIGNLTSLGIDDNATSTAITIDSSQNADFSGNITLSGTVDGRDVATDGTKLDGIEASADVTDAANVTAAGALMDSEVTNLAQVKAFDSSDYATAAQGTTADSALQNVVEDTTPQLGGNLDFNGNLATSFTSTGIDDNATSTAITIDSSENVGIGGGTTRRLYVTSAQQIVQTIESTSVNAYMSFVNATTAENRTRIGLKGTDTLVFRNGAVDRMYINSTGTLSVATTVAAPGYGNSTVGCALSSSGIVHGSGGSAPGGTFNRNGTGTVVGFYNTGALAGRVNISGSTTVQYITSSDARLKENIVDAPAGNIDAIRVRSFDWSTDGTHQTYGMIAQELAEVAPDAVSQGETEEDMWGVDYSKLVPMMIKEIQDLKAEVAALKGTN